jgi:drug/metabolite transporter (DMT)-like permease
MRISGVLRGAYGNAYLLLTICAICWGGNAIAGRLSVGEISPMLLTLFRWLGVVILIWIVARPRVIAEAPVLRAHLGYFMMMGGIGFAGFNILYYIAAHSTTAINLGILQGALPIFVLLGSYAAYRTAITPVQCAGILVTVLGVAVVTVKGDPRNLLGLVFNTGDLLMVAACLVYAIYAVLLRKRPEVSGLAMFAVMATAALLATLPFAIWEAMSGGMIWPTRNGWAIVGFVVLFPSFTSQLFFMRGVQLIGPGRAGVFINLVPIFASGFSVLLLGEHFAVFHGVGIGRNLGHRKSSSRIVISTAVSGRWPLQAKTWTNTWVKLR